MEYYLNPPSGADGIFRHSVLRTPQMRPIADEKGVKKLDVEF